MSEVNIENLRKITAQSIKDRTNSIEKKLSKEEELQGKAERTARMVLDDLPKKMREAASEGNNSVEISYASGEELCPLIFPIIERWANYHNFDVKTGFNKEGQYNTYDFMYISW